MDNSNNISNSNIMLVKNPNTGKHINVMPLFKLAFNLSQTPANGNLSIIKKKIEEVIRLISTSQFREEAIEEFVKDMTSNLYLITDMFEEMENF